MSKENGKVMVDIKWVIMIVLTSFIGLLAKDFYGLPSRYNLLEQKITFISETVSEIKTEQKRQSQELSMCKLLVKHKGK